MNVQVMTHGSVAYGAARELTVSCTGLKCGCRSAAADQPVTSKTGAATEETTPHHGTSRTPLGRPRCPWHAAKGRESGPPRRRGATIGFDQQVGWGEGGRIPDGQGVRGSLG